MPQVNIVADGDTEEDLTRAMQEAVKQCDFGWNRCQGKSENAAFYYCVKGYEKSPLVIINF